jgi:hypothetical protein
MSGWVAGAIAVSAVVGAAASSDASRKQANAGQKAIDAQRGMFDTTQGNIQPYLQTGSQYAGTLSDLGKTDYATHQFGAADLKTGLAPNYDWVKQQGLMAANNASSAQGGVAGTGGQRAAIDYAENLAGNAYQQAFNNFNSQRNNIFSNLNNIASLGSNAAVGQGNISANVGGNIGNTLTGMGNAQAAGSVGMGNAISGGIGNYLGYNYLTNMGQQSSIGGGYGAGSAQNAWTPSPNGFVGPSGP